MTDETFSGLPTGGPRDLGAGSRLGAYVVETPRGGTACLKLCAKHQKHQDEHC